MKKLISLVLIASVIVFTILKQQHQTQERTQPFVIVNIGNRTWIEDVQNKLKPVMNNIIKNEVLKANATVTEFPEFQIKKRHHVTLFYSKQVPEHLENLIKESFKQVSFTNISCLKQVTFSNQFEFFGINKDELVVIMQDKENCLKNLRAQIIKIMLQQHKNFDEKSLHELLATEKHNIFDFMPHDSLGRLPMKYIIELSSKEIFENIKLRILKEIPQLLKNITISNNVDFKELIFVNHKVQPLLIIPT